MTYIVSGGALNSTQTKPHASCYCQFLSVAMYIFLLLPFLHMYCRLLLSELITLKCLVVLSSKHTVASHQERQFLCKKCFIDNLLRVPCVTMIYWYLCLDHMNLQNCCEDGDAFKHSILIACIIACCARCWLFLLRFWDSVFWRQTHMGSKWCDVGRHCHYCNSLFMHYLLHDCL